MIIVAAPMFKQGCLKLLLSSCNFMVSIIDVYNILTRDCLWIPVMDVEFVDCGCRVPRNGHCTTRNLVCRSIHSDRFWNLYLGNG